MLICPASVAYYNCFLLFLTFNHNAKQFQYLNFLICSSRNCPVLEVQFNQRAEQPYLKQTGWVSYREWQRQQEWRGPGGEELLETSLKVGLKWHNGLQWVANLHNGNWEVKEELWWRMRGILVWTGHYGSMVAYRGKTQQHWIKIKLINISHNTFKNVENTKMNTHKNLDN